MTTALDTQNSITLPNTDESPLKVQNLAQFTTQLTEANTATTAQNTRSIPPLERWQPKLSGTMNMTIKANGEWWHEGEKVTRQSLVDMFAKVLWAETQADGRVFYYLKSPVEKWQITVEDAPLLVTNVEVIEEKGTTYLQFITTHGDVVRADSAHPLRLGLPFQAQNAELNIKQASQPYLLVRQNGDSVLYALLHRNVFYHLVSLGELEQTETATTLTLTSGDATFRLSMDNAER